MYGDMSILVERAQVQFLDKCGHARCVMSGHGVQSCRKLRRSPQFAAHGVTGRLFWAVYTGTRPGVPPSSGRGRGGGDTGSLLPGVLPPQLGACVGAYRQRHVS